MDVALGIVIMVVVIAGGVMWAKRSNSKRLAEAWTGTVVKKWIASYSDEDGNVTKVPTVQVRLDSGKKKKLSVAAATYNGLSEGDKVKKGAGQKDPAKA